MIIEMNLENEMLRPDPKGKNRKVFLSKEYAGTHLMKKGISSSSEFDEMCHSGKRPEFIPAHPYRAYGKEFKGWGDFLGTTKENYLKKAA